MKKQEILHIYCRVSSDQQLENYSIQNQIDTGIEIAKRNNMDWIIHNEGSASSKYDDLSNRPVLFGILQAIREDQIKHLYCYVMDRLSRNEQLANAIKYDLFKHKVKLYTKDGAYDFENSVDILTYNIISAVSEYDNKLRSTRFKAGIVKGIQAGKVQGIVPFGYERDSNKIIKVCDEEAKTVKLIFELYLKGMGQTSIANELNKQGLKTKRDKRWAGVKVGEMLQNTIYIGKRNWNGNIFNSPQIITEEDFNKVQSMFKNHTQYKNAKIKYFVMLRDMVKCNKCGHNLNKIQNKNIYSCLTYSQRDRYEYCGLKSINADKLESIVWYSVLHTLLNDKYLQRKLKRDFENLPKLRPLIEKNIASFKRQLADLNNKRNTATSLYINGKIDVEYLDSELLKIVAEIDSVNQQLTEKQEQLNNLDEGEGKVKELINRLNEMAKLRAITDDEQKRIIITELVSHITVDYDISNKQHYIEIVFKNPNYNTTLTSKGVDINTGQNIVTEMITENLIIEQEDNTSLYSKKHVDTRQRK